MTQVVRQCWVLSWLLPLAVGCSSPAATPKPSAQASAATVRVPIKASVPPALDPEAPEYWATHVGEPERFTALVERLEGFLKPDVGKASDGSAAARERARLRSDRVVVPLTRSYLEGAPKLDHAQRARLLALLVNTRDERIEPAVRFALTEFVAKPPRTSLRDEPGDPDEPHDAYDEISTASIDFQDSTLVPWLLLQIKQAPGNSTERGIYRSRLLSAAMQLATPAQWPSVAGALDKFGDASEREFAKDCAQALNECGDDLACYQKMLAAAVAGPASGRYVGLKAGHRIAQLGDAASAEQLALALGGTRDLILVGIMVRAIDHLLPRGSARVESVLAKLLVSEGREPPPGFAAYGPELVYRLRARAVASP